MTRLTKFHCEPCHLAKGSRSCDSLLSSRIPQPRLNHPCRDLVFTDTQLANSIGIYGYKYFEISIEDCTRMMFAAFSCGRTETAQHSIRQCKEVKNATAAYIPGDTGRQKESPILEHILADVGVNGTRPESGCKPFGSLRFSTYAILDSSVMPYLAPGPDDRYVHAILKSSIVVRRR
jgi:hypothetical protein